MLIIWTFPCVPSTNTMFMLEAMTFKMAVEVESWTDFSQLLVEAWTNIYHKDNPEGIWHAIPLELISARQEDNKHTVTAIFGNSVILTSHGKYAFTFRMKEKALIQPTASREDGSWLWVGNYQEDGIVIVHPPSTDMWSKGPNFDQILGAVHLGNFMAASVADNLDFDAVLNLADNLDLVTSKFCRPIDYKKIPIQDGAMNAIDPKQIQEAVEWLQEHANQCSKILVNCRAGIGRAGSIVVSYVFAENPSMSYDQAYNFVFSRRFIYPHKGLKDTLYRLYPRKS